jgi:glyoxalase family protein
MDEVPFHMSAVLGFRPVGTEGSVHVFETGNGGPGTFVEFDLEPRRVQGSWGLGVGAVHHTAFWLDDAEAQAAFKFHSEGIGYMDISDRKDRNYFESVYFRNPSGALFEAAFSDPAGFLKDETADMLVPASAARSTAI